MSFNEIRAILNSLRPEQFLNVDKMKVITDLPAIYYIKDRIVTKDPEKFLKDLWSSDYDPKLLKKFRLVSNIPEDINWLILLSLPYEDIIRMKDVSRDHRKILENNKFWSKLYERDFKKTISENCYNQYSFERINQELRKNKPFFI